MPEQVLVLGGGVIGLEIAWELQRYGCQVTVLDRSDLSGRASPAGAGILAPGHATRSWHPLDRMLGRSADLHRQLAPELLLETQIDPCLIDCGGLYLAEEPGEAASLAAQATQWPEEGIDCELLHGATLTSSLGRHFQPTVHPLAAWLVPSEGQLDNERLLAALHAAVTGRGGAVRKLPANCELSLPSGQLAGNDQALPRLLIGGQSQEFDWLVVAAGAWSGGLVRELGWELPMVPVRGQMLQYGLEERLCLPVVNCGSRYIVPRHDGRVLVGSTMEEVGFDAATTDEALHGLAAFAGSLFPVLGLEKLTGSWAGLRPATFDGMPVIGKIPGWNNVLIATGHLRSGLQLSTGTAAMIREMIFGTTVSDPEFQRLVSPERFSVNAR